MERKTCKDEYVYKEYYKDKDDEVWEKKIGTEEDLERGLVYKKCL